MNNIKKILLRNAMIRVRNKIKPKIADEQNDFVERKGTTNVIYILGSIIELAQEVQKDVNCAS